MGKMTRLLSSSIRRQASVIFVASTVTALRHPYAIIPSFFATTEVVQTATIGCFIHHHQQQRQSQIPCHSNGITKLWFSSSNKKSQTNVNNKNNKKSGGGGVKYNKKKQKHLFRADRVLSNRGVGTRSQTFELLKSRRITMIITENDDETSEELRILLTGPSDKIPMDAKLLLDNTHEIPPIAPLLYIYHKPKFMLSAMNASGADKDKKHLGQVLEPRLIKGGMHPVGRLDYDTSGLLLFSSNGDLTQRLLHPRHEVEKEYVATVEHFVDFEKLSEQLKNGVETTEGIHTATLLDISSPLDIDHSKEVHVSDDDNDSSTKTTVLTDVRLVVAEGKYRMVRRMLANCGHPVVNLRRERHGEILLNDLEVGEFRDATPAEIKWAESLLPSKKNKNKKKK